MKKLFFIGALFALATSALALPGGKGPGGKTVEIRASAGYLPYAHFKVKDRSYNFYYTGIKLDSSFTYYSTANFQAGIFLVNIKLNNKENTDTDKEKIDVIGGGLLGIYSLPIAIRPFFSFGAGYYLATIEREGNTTLKHHYKQGTAIKVSLGISPRVRGLGFYLKWDGDYVSYEKGRNEYDKNQKLFNIKQDSYSINGGIIIAI